MNVGSERNPKDRLRALVGLLRKSQVTEAVERRYLLLSSVGASGIGFRSSEANACMPEYRMDTTDEIQSLVLDAPVLLAVACP